MAIHKRTVYIKPSELERINRLLAIESLEEMTDGELIAAGANTNHLEGLFHIRFDDGSYLNIDLCSGTHNYWDDMEWMNAHGTHGVVLDPEYEFGDIEFEVEGEFYLVHFTTDKHADKSCQVEDMCTYDRSDWRYTQLAPAAFFAAFPAVFENTKTDWFREKIKNHQFIYACGCSYSLFFFCPRCGKKLDYMEWIKDLWKDFGDVPMNPETECIESPWLHFEPGTHREDVWLWFEDTFDVVVGELMYE